MWGIIIYIMNSLYKHLILYHVLPMNPLTLACVFPVLSTNTLCPCYFMLINDIIIAGCSNAIQPEIALK